MGGPLDLKIPQLLLQILNISRELIFKRLILNLFNIVLEQFGQFFSIVFQLQHFTLETLVDLHLFFMDFLYLVHS